MARFVLIVFIFMFGADVVAAAGDISQFVFTTDSQTIKPNEISQKITIQAQDAGGNSANLVQTACLELKTASGAGEFSSSDTNWNPVGRLTMSKGSANRNFYYKDSATGVYELSLNVSLRPEEENSPCASWPIENWDIKWNAKQNIIVSLSPNNPPLDDNQQQPAAEPTGGSFWPTEEQIFANAGEDRVTPVGADIVFLGKALGLKKEPLENARYLWNFGDGETATGQNVRHFYKHPGKYIIVLDVSSGGYAASDRAIVTAAPNMLEISEANGEFIKLRNSSSYIFDISGWFLGTLKNNQTFKFQDSSLINANSDLIISSNVSQIKPASDEEVNLLYPNGSVAFTYKVIGQLMVVTSQSSPHPSPSKGKERGEGKIVESAIGGASNKFNSATATAATTSSEQENQIANVIAVAGEKDFMKGKWIFLTILLGIFAAGGLFFTRRYSDIASKSDTDKLDAQN